MTTNLTQPSNLHLSMLAIYRWCWSDREFYESSTLFMQSVCRLYWKVSINSMILYFYCVELSLNTFFWAIHETVRRLHISLHKVVLQVNKWKLLVISYSTLCLHCKVGNTQLLNCDILLLNVYEHTSFWMSTNTLCNNHSSYVSTVTDVEINGSKSETNH